MEEETKLGNGTLEAKVKETGDKELAHLLEWSLAVNVTIEGMVKGVAPFPGVREFLEQAGQKADMIVVSQTPVEALTREWEEHGLTGHVEIIAGQEYGTKTEHLQYAAKDKYDSDKILMIGDAPGDRKAAVSNGALFFPINPGAEDASWARLLEEGMDRFFNGAFAGEYQDKLVNEFEAMLPETPPWPMA
jgi:phosphoglycolate phosphatase-like HAD superfamily hydrolase